MFDSNMYPMLNCQSGSDYVPGLPEFVLNIGHLQMFTFNSSEYFIYPTQNIFDTPFKAIFGLGYEQEKQAQRSNDTFYFG